MQGSLTDHKILDDSLISALNVKSIHPISEACNNLLHKTGIICQVIFCTAF